MSTLTIGTWNVEYAAGAAKNAARLARLLAEDADIWVLTETHDELDLSATHRAVSTHQRPTGRAGARWCTIWSRWPLEEVLEVEDPVRTAACVVSSPLGRVLVYATVLPWHTDPGPDAQAPARNWHEQYRVTPLQGAEWAALRTRFPDAALVVAGDLNMNLGGRHYYGTRLGRQLLEAAMEGANLRCATRTELVADGLLGHPPIDHVLVPVGWQTRVVSAWEGRDAAGIRLSDHSGLVVSAGKAAGE